jgi:AraC-like DNA-binding protein/tellurite resistance-related uncharacterized protein
METGHLLPIEQLEDFMKKNPLPEAPPSSLSCLDPAYRENANNAINFSGAFAPLTSRFKLRNMVFLNSNEGLSIRKHSNYFPSFCHAHDFMEVCLVLKGQCNHQFYASLHHKEPSESLMMHEDDLLIIPPGIYHTVNSITDSVILNIIVKRNAIDKTIAQFFADDVPLFGYFTKIIYENKIDSFLLFHLEKDAFLNSLLDQLLLEYCNRPPLYHQIMNQIFGLYCSIIQRRHGNEIKLSNIAPAGTNYIPKFLLYLQSNYADFSMKNMENYFHLSDSYISRVFKANTGSTIVETLTAIRLETAKKLLQNTNILVDDIAAYAGYEDTTYFIRIFKKKYQMTPLQYRKNILKSSPN